MRLSVLHRTSFYYGAPVIHSVNTLHLEPQEFPFQKTISSLIRVIPAVRLMRFTDMFQNATHQFDLPEPHVKLEIESRLRVRNLQYFASQSWPFPHSLMIAFTADYLDGDIRIDENELSEARWFGPDDAWPEKVPHLSVSSLLVDAHRPPGRISA